jgi:hypothetical protein
MKAVHLLTQPNEQREARSSVELMLVMREAGYEYIQIVNEPYKGDFLTPPRQCNDRPFTLTPAHYGCYLAHKRAIHKHLDAEGLWVFECDAVFTVEHAEAAARMKRVVEVCNNHPFITAFTLGYRHNGQGIMRPEPDIITINQWIETHAYYIPWSSKPMFDAIFDKDWDALDYVYTIYLCDQTGAQIGIFADRPICVQGVGVSLIDGKLKGSETHFRNVRYKSSMGWKA